MAQLRFRKRNYFIGNADEHGLRHVFDGATPVGIYAEHEGRIWEIRADRESDREMLEALAKQAESEGLLSLALGAWNGPSGGT